MWVYGISFTVKLCMQNLTKEWKQSPVVILHQANFYSIFILCFWLRIIRRSDQSVWFMNFSSQIFYNDINHAYRATMFKKKFFWLLPFNMTLASYCCYEKVYRTMCTAFVSYILKHFYSFSAVEQNNIESEDEFFAQEFSYKE